MRALLAVSIGLLGACSSPAAPDSGPSPSDAGTDSPALIDAPTLADAGVMCAEGYAGCTIASAVDDTTTSGITIGVAGTGVTGDNYRYATPCIRIHAGTTISIINNSVHPLRAASCSPSDTPITGSTGTTFTFPHAGRYGYWCENHGSDDGAPPGMAGMIIVE